MKREGKLHSTLAFTYYGGPTEAPDGARLRYWIVIVYSRRLTASIMHSMSSDAPTRLVVLRGQRTSDDAPDAVPTGQYDPTGHLFCK